MQVKGTIDMTYVDTARGEFSRTFKVLVAGASLCSGLALSLWATQQPELWKWLPAIFCFSVIGVVTLPGRFARPCGYFVASCVVAWSLWALWLGLTGTESILGALLFAGLFGMPAARYLLFGIAPSPESGSPATQVHVVRTSSFEVEPGEDAQTNPGLYGRAFSKFVAEGLRAQGEPVEAVIPEDFGWCVLLGKKPARRWVGCVSREGSTEEWIAFAVVEQHFLGRLFGRFDARAEQSRLSTLLGEVVRGSPGLVSYSTNEQ